MLVLSRKPRQRIVIGENIELVVVAVSGDRVTLGFNAPSDVPIHREEVVRRIHSEERHADAACCVKPDQRVLRHISEEPTTDNGTTGNECHAGELPTAAALVQSEEVLANLRQSKGKPS